jgi:hypothetical protein
VNPLANEETRVAYQAAGSPAVPAVKIGDRIVGGLMHVSQVASLLGLDDPSGVDARRHAWDIATIQQVWLDVLAAVDWKTMTSPTPTRNRTVRDLVVNVFEVFSLLEDAWQSGEFVVSPEGQERQVESLTERDDAIRYAEERAARWSAFLLEHFVDDVQHPGPDVDVWEDLGERRRKRATLPFAALLAFARNHTALHLRQVSVFLDRAGIEHPSDAVLDQLSGLQLPADVYGEGAEKLDRLAHNDLAAVSRRE